MYISGCPVCLVVQYVVVQLCLSALNFDVCSVVGTRTSLNPDLSVSQLSFNGTCSREGSEIIINLAITVFKTMFWFCALFIRKSILITDV